jgi:simple sugar transport system permease protein
MAFQFPELALLSLAMMLSMVAGGIDLSIVSAANLAGVIAAMTMARLSAAHGPAGTAWLAASAGVIAATLTGLACGLTNGLLVALVGVPPILATLGTLQLFMGCALVLTGGQAVTGLPEMLQWIGSGTALGLPVPFWIFLIGAGGIAVLTNATVFGVEARLIGTNRVAAWFSGVPVRSVLVRTYVATGVIASLTGVLMVVRANSAKADYGSSYLLESILVAVLGGVSPAGGSGRVLGVGIAVIALQLLSSGFGMMHLTSYATELAWGGFLLLVMVVNRWFERRKE